MSMIRKFAEGARTSAGEFYMPREVAITMITMAHMLDPEPGMTVYDPPCCGSGGLLIKCHLRLLATKGEKQNGRLKLLDRAGHFASLDAPDALAAAVLDFAG